MQSLCVDRSTAPRPRRGSARAAPSRATQSRPVTRAIARVQSVRGGAPWSRFARECARAAVYGCAARFSVRVIKYIRILWPFNAILNKARHRHRTVQCTHPQRRAASQRASELPAHPAALFLNLDFFLSSFANITPHHAAPRRAARRPPRPRPSPAPPAAVRGGRALRRVARSRPRARARRVRCGRRVMARRTRAARRAARLLRRVRARRVESAPRGCRAVRAGIVRGVFVRAACHARPPRFFFYAQLRATAFVSLFIPPQ